MASILASTVLHLVLLGWQFRPLVEAGAVFSPPIRAVLVMPKNSLQATVDSEGSGVFADWSPAAQSVASASPTPDNGSGGHNEVVGVAGRVAPSEFVPSKELAQRATPVDPVIVPFPDEGGVKGGRVVLDLYVLQNGVVERVEVAASDLPAPFIEAAKAAFLAAHFYPGMKDGRVVNVKMKIEVGFVAK